MSTMCMFMWNQIKEQTFIHPSISTHGHSCKNANK